MQMTASSATPAALDPITFSVIKNGLDAIVDEVAYTILRTARSEIVKDVMDYSAAICDRQGRMVAQAKTIALHLGAIPEAMTAMLARYGNDLHPGDAVILNDPYEGGMHLPDIFMFAPFFHGGAIEGFCVVICHHTDVGGRVAGSNASDSTEIFQEGLRIPLVKLYERGQVNQMLERIIALNVRVPDLVLGDLRAQYAACRVGLRELGKLYDRFGRDTARLYLEELLDYAERLLNDLQALAHLLEAHDEAIEAVALVPDRDLEVVLLVAAVRVRLADIPGNTAAAQHRSRDAGVRSHFRRKHAYPTSPR